MRASAVCSGGGAKPSTGGPKSSASTKSGSRTEAAQSCAAEAMRSERERGAKRVVAPDAPHGPQRQRCRPQVRGLAGELRRPRAEQQLHLAPRHDDSGAKAARCRISMPTRPSQDDRGGRHEATGRAAKGGEAAVADNAAAAGSTTRNWHARLAAGPLNERGLADAADYSAGCGTSATHRASVCGRPLCPADVQHVASAPISAFTVYAASAE